MIDIESIPPELKAVPHWVVWKAGQVKPDGKFDKVPVHPRTGRNLKGEILPQCMGFDVAVAAHQTGRFSGIGFYPKNTEFVIGDIDNVVRDGHIADWAGEDILQLGTYVEISPSGRGLRWIAIGQKPGPETNNQAQGCEMYDKDSKQFLTITGDALPGFDIIRADIQTEVDVWYWKRIAKNRNATVAPAPEDGPGNSLTPEEVKARLLASPKYKRLWAGDTTGYSSRSEAELALLDELAVLTAGDIEKMREVYFESPFALSVYSDKAERTFDKTAQKAIQGMHDHYQLDARAEFTTTGRDDRKPCQRAIAEEVVERIGADNIRHDSRTFWRWDGLGLWKRVDDAEVKQISLDVLTHRGKVTRSSVDSVTDLVKTLIYSPEVMEPTQPFVNCMNGELHWSDARWELRPHRKEHLAISRIPVPWEDRTAGCPRFDLFLDEVFRPDEDALEKRQLLLEMIGYSLVPSAKYEKFALLVGNGANGKSVLLNVLQALLGRENCAAVSPVQFGNRFQKAHLHGKLVNLVTELPEGAVIADAELKAIVSGELITAEHKLQKPFDFRPTCTVWIATNHMPGTRDFSDALFRRACVLKFNRTFSEAEQDKQLADKLVQELPGVLYAALEAYGNVLRRGAFTMPSSVVEARKEWRLDADQVAAFIDDEVERVPGEKVESQIMYNNYRHWALGAGIGRLLGRKAFTHRLVRLGFETGKGSGGVRTIWGARLKGATEEFH